MKTYWLNFGSTDPRIYTGLSPTFIQFFNQDGSTLAPPGITEIFTGSGAYRFQYDIGPTLSIFFLCDGGATLNSAVRYIQGTMDPLDKVDQNLGSTFSSFGSTSVMPSDVFGYVKRTHEWLEGTQTFLKSSGSWSVYSRGASTLLGLKTISSSTTGVTAIP